MIEFAGVTKTFPDSRGGEVFAVRDLDLIVRDGETHCLIGTSGCGKTTMMKMVNRLVEPTCGRVAVGGEAVAALDPIALRRRIGYVVQAGGLFPHMSVERNVGVMCALEGWSAARTRTRVEELLGLVNLPAREFAHRHPGELSGGQQQRVGVARALALDPEYVLMDEPFGALDPITRGQVHAEFRQLQRTLHKTIILVTHDLNEAFELGERISLMHRGQLLQTGTPDELRQRPAGPIAAAFLAGQLVAPESDRAQ